MWRAVHTGKTRPLIRELLFYVSEHQQWSTKPNIDFQYVQSCLRSRLRLKSFDAIIRRHQSLAMFAFRMIHDEKLFISHRWWIHAACRPEMRNPFLERIPRWNFEESLITITIREWAKRSLKRMWTWFLINNIFYSISCLAFLWIIYFEPEIVS